jgi:hypothetical protein
MNEIAMTRKCLQLRAYGQLHCSFLSCSICSRRPCVWAQPLLHEAEWQGSLVDFGAWPIWL